MKRVVTLVLVLLLIPSVCLGAENEAVLGILTKLSVDEDTLNVDLVEAYFSRIPFSGFKFFDNLNSMVAALGSGRIAALRVDGFTADYLVSRTEQYVIFDLPTVPVYNMSYSMLVLEENSELCARISSAIRDMKSDGTLEVLKKQYIDDCIAGTDPEAVKPEHFDGAATLTVALTGDRPPMDYVSDAGEPIGFNTALVSEVARRLKMNAKFISVDTGARAVSLQSKACDAVFWSEVGDYNDREGTKLEDIPEHTVISEAYLGSPLVVVTLSSSPLIRK